MTTLTAVTTLDGKSLSRSDRDRIAAAAEKFSSTDDLPDEIRETVIGLLCALADGNDVTVADPNAYITPAKAASIVGVSRPLFNELLDEGSLPFFETPGGHRKIKAGDVYEYVELRDRFSADLAAARAARKSDAEEIADELGLTPDEAAELGIY